MTAWRSIQQSVDWIEEHLADDISINSLAGIANLSQSYFQRLFRRKVGLNAMEYVRLRRLARISNRLIFNRNTVVEGCFYYGFNNHETFCRAFKNGYGISPTQFRKNMAPLRHFPKPILTEKGIVTMEYEVKIEELGEIAYLAIPHLVSMSDDAEAKEAQQNLWESCFNDRLIERLKAVCGSDTVYALFCNTYDPDTSLISYDIACINKAKAISDEFRAITLRPSKYAAVSGAYKAPITMKQAYDRFNDIFWQEWLPKTNYKSIIDYDCKPGSASIELYDPPNVNAAEFKIKIWYPIIEK